MLCGQAKKFFNGVLEVTAKHSPLRKKGNKKDGVRQEFVKEIGLYYYNVHRTLLDIKADEYFTNSKKLSALANLRV